MRCNLRSNGRAASAVPSISAVLARRSLTAPIRYTAKSTSIAFLLACTACGSTEFSLVGKDEYRLFKMSDACAIGSPASVLAHIRQEAVKFCAGRKEAPVEISATTEMGIPAIRCTSATLTFRCELPPEPK